MGIFSDFQGKLTPQSVVQSSRNSNSSKLSCMSSLPASMKKDQMKISQVKVETPFSHHEPYLLPWKPVVGSGRISNSFKLLFMLSLPANMKRIRSRTAEKKWRHHFSHYKPMGIFLRRSRAANSSVGGPIRLKFELVRALMHVFVNRKYELK